MATETAPTTAVDRIVATAAQIKDGSIVSLSEVLDAIKPPAPKPERISPAPAPAIMSNAERDAVAKLPAVFGQINPQVPTILTEAAIDALVEERVTLDQVAKLAQRRKDDVRTIVFNHLDAVIEAEEGFDPLSAPEKDEKGFYVRPGSVKSTKIGKRLTREVRSGSVALSAEALKELADDPDEPWFTHDDYLAMTTQVRQLDEAKVLMFMRGNPDKAVRAMAKATKRGADSVACYLR